MCSTCFVLPDSITETVFGDEYKYEGPCFVFHLTFVILSHLGPYCYMLGLLGNVTLVPCHLTMEWHNIVMCP
jgi:hypothetical protein